MLHRDDLFLALLEWVLLFRAQRRNRLPRNDDSIMLEYLYKGLFKKPVFDRQDSYASIITVFIPDNFKG
jgi:hypothetical protein